MAERHLSVVVSTRNEAANIGNCLAAFDRFRDAVELIVVDNESTDNTREIALDAGARVLVHGPERSAQRNIGWRLAQCDWVVILDADMILPEATIKEMLAIAARRDKDAPVAYWIPEVRTGKGFRARVRNFERSFYDGTCIDALRMFRKTVLQTTGGYDEKLLAGPEDWDLDLRILATGAKCAVLRGHLLHNEKRLSLRRVLEKKAYYTRSMVEYQAKWAGHPAVRKQFSLWYRLVGVFVENGKWKRLLRHPLLYAGVLFERCAVGWVYLRTRKNGFHIDSNQNGVEK